MSRAGWLAMVLLAIVWALFLTSPAWATPPDNRPPDNRPPGSDGGSVTVTGGSAESNSQADSTAVSDATSSSQANAQVTVNVTPDTSAGSQAAPTSNSLTVNQAAQPNNIKIRNTPTAIAPDIMPTISCFKTASGAVSFPGFGAAGAGGKIDPSCVKREYIRLAYAMGAADRALWLWCQQPEVWMDFGSVEECLLFDPNAPSPKAEAVPMMMSLNAALEAEPILLAQNVQREELEEEVLEPMEQQQAIINAQEERLRALERRLEAQARAAEAAERRREEFKQQLAEKYLEQQQATEEDQPAEESEQ